MTSVAKSRRMAQETLDRIARVEEMEDLTPLLILVRQHANTQLHLYDAMDAIAVLADRIDTLEGQLNNYRMGEL